MNSNTAARSAGKKIGLFGSRLVRSASTRRIKHNVPLFSPPPSFGMVSKPTLLVNVHKRQSKISGFVSHIVSTVSMLIVNDTNMESFTWVQRWSTSITTLTLPYRCQHETLACQSTSLLASWGWNPSKPSLELSHQFGGGTLPSSNGKYSTLRPYICS